jgi:hypothetical protein
MSNITATPISLWDEAELARMSATHPDGAISLGDAVSKYNPTPGDSWFD